MTVEIIPDADWVSTLGRSEQESLRRTDTRRIIVQALHRWGPVTDPHGHATAELHRRMGQLGYDAGLRTLTGRLEGDAMSLAVDRDINGKRTTRIELVRIPEAWSGWLEGLNGLNGSETPAPDTPPEPAEDVTGPPDVAPAFENDGIPLIMRDGQTTELISPEPDGDDYTDEPLADAGIDPDQLRLDIAGSVATALLTKVVEIISTPDQSKSAVMERDDARRRLADALDANAALRRELAKTGDDLLATKTERDGLRQRLRMAEANLQKLTSPNSDAQRIVNDLVSTELAKVMRAAPTPHHGD